MFFHFTTWISLKDLIKVPKEKPKWAGHRVAKRLAWRKGLGRRRRTRNSWLTLKNTAMEVGVHCLPKPVSSRTNSIIPCIYIYVHACNHIITCIWFILFNFLQWFETGLQRCGKSCRLRWTNYLRPDIKRGKFSLQEEQTIIQLHALLGNRYLYIYIYIYMS